MDESRTITSLTEHEQELNPQTCPRCGALVDGRMVDKHHDWHEEARLGSPTAREWSSSGI